MDAYASFRHRDYRLLLTGNFLANLGLQILNVAASWDLYRQTKSALVLGNVGFAQVLPFILFSLFAGQLADTRERRRILQITQCLMVVSSVALVAAPSSVVVIYAALFFNAIARTFQGPARQALFPHTVPVESLRNAIAWNSSAQEISSVSGPAVAGFIVALSGPKTAYMVQAVCAVLALACFALLRTRSTLDPNRQPATASDLLEGIRFLRERPLILSAVSLDMFAVLFGGATALLPIYAAEILHTGPSGLGWLRAAPSVGAVAMALITAHRLHVERAGRALLIAVAGFGIATVVFAISTNFWLSIAMLVLTGAFDNISVVLRHSLVQTETPDRVRGRVMAVNNIFISCSNQLGAVESGWAAALVGVVPSVALGGVATVAIAAGYAWGARTLREWRQR